MIRLVMKKRLYSYERIIFPRNIERSKCDIIRYMRFFELPDSIQASECDTYRTPVTDLMMTEEQIKAGYSKEVRYEVGRAGRENIRFMVYDQLDRKRDEEFIRSIEEQYFAFCEQINHPELIHNLEIAEFEKMIEDGNIIISKAEFENGWTYHIYQVDGQNALLWFSFSDYRKENANKSMAGWANRGLHDYDIMYFKHVGYSLYDWGNIASEVEPNQIDKFKMSFGGEIKTAYCCFVGNTIKGKFLVWLRRIKNKGN